MKRSTKYRSVLLGGASIALVLVLLLSFLKNDNSSVSSTPKLGQITSHSEDSSATVDVDILMFDTIKGLSSQAKLIVVGDVIKRNTHTRNLARNPLNIKEDAKDYRAMSQEYDFKVSEWLKGNSNDVINIVYPDTIEYFKGNVSEKLLPLKAGQKYVLFLAKHDDGAYSGIAEPWQFKISSNRVEPVTEIQGLTIKDLKEEMTEEEFVGLIKQYLNE